MRRPLPDKVKNAPQLFLGLELYYFAFVDLCGDRQTGWGVGPIPWTAKQRYAEKHGFSEEQTEDLYFFLTEMDRAYIQYMEKKSKSKK